MKKQGLKEAERREEMARKRAEGEGK